MSPDMKPTHTYVHLVYNANIIIAKPTPLLSYISCHLKVSAANRKNNKKKKTKLNSDAGMLDTFFLCADFELCIAVR